MSTLVKMPFDVKDIKLNLIYTNEELKNYNNQIINCNRINEIYGNLMFPKTKEDRPYIYASFVTSIDGKIAFDDAPVGPLIARNNELDANGATADWWILNLLRANCDAIIIGTGTLQAEKDFMGHVFDQHLEDARVTANKPAVPYNIVMSIEGSDVDLKHPLFRHPDIPVLICTSKLGQKYLESKIDRLIIINENNYQLKTNSILNTKNPVLIVSGDEVPNAKVHMQILKHLGIDYVLVETPGYVHHLMKHKLVDELFLSYSCLYIGGDSLGLGNGQPAFTSKEHPHTKVLSIHNHSDSFFYFRHKVMY